MVREDLVNSAVSFLQDPSVASAPLEKRISFLQSKNLTQEEVDVSLARAAAGAAPTSAPSQTYAYGQQTAQQPPPGYGPYPGYWPQPPPEVPRRDWRDWFIMATVMGGVGFGLYVTAKRYVLPLIKPPTPPQLSQDKASIDESFEKSFSLLEQLEAETKALKEAEEARTARLDAALSELEATISTLKESDRRREDDARRNADELRMLRDLIPKALESEKSATESRLKDLGTELKSLKTLVGTRMGGANPSGHRATPSYGGSAGAGASTGGGGVASSGANAAPVAHPESSAPEASASTSSPTTTPATTTPGSSTFPKFGSGKATIPAWQMAAAKRSQTNGTSDKDTSTSGTVEE